MSWQIARGGERRREKKERKRRVGRGEREEGRERETHCEELVLHGSDLEKWSISWSL
jgi:hypothetical protein